MHEGSKYQGGERTFLFSSGGSPDVKGVILLDGDNRELPDHDIASEGLRIERWKRYEVENYLLHPNALARFVRKRTLFSRDRLSTT